MKALVSVYGQQQSLKNLKIQQNERKCSEVNTQRPQRHYQDKELPKSPFMQVYPCLICKQEIQILNFNKDNNSSCSPNQEIMSELVDDVIIPNSAEVQNLQQQQQQFRQQNQKPQQIIIDNDSLQLTLHDLTSQIFKKMKQAKTLNWKRFIQICFHFGNFTYYILFFLYSFGKMEQNDRQNNNTIMVVENEDVKHQVIIYLILILNVLSLLCQIITNLNIVSQLRNKLIFSVTNIYLLRFYYIVFDAFSQILFLYYSWVINSLFKALGILLFILVTSVEFYYLSLYANLISQINQFLKVYHVDPLQLQLLQIK